MVDRRKFQLPTWVLTIGLKQKEVLLMDYFYYRSHLSGDFKKGVCIRQKQIAKDLGIGRTSVIRGISALKKKKILFYGEEKSLLTVNRNYSVDGGLLPNTYHVLPLEKNDGQETG